MIFSFIYELQNYMDKSSLLGKGRKRDNTLCSETSSMRDGFHTGFLFLVRSAAPTPKRAINCKPFNFIFHPI